MPQVVDKKESLTIFIRDKLYDLDLSKAEDLKTYDHYKLEYIKLFEGKETKAYKDTANKVTIGYGFNMDARGAKLEWKKVFGDSVSFDDAYRGKIKISDKQAEDILKYSVDVRENELRRIYGEIWDKLHANEKIALLSAYYNGPGLVDKNTQVFFNLKEYILTNDPKHLKQAIEEHLKENKRNPELKSRRELEAKMLDSTKSPFYVKPNGNNNSKKPFRAVLNETVIPIGFEKNFPAAQDSDFVIWRTKHDDRVRAEHLAHEGKIYSRSAIPDKGYGCRCELVPVPSNLILVDKKNKIISLNSWIRYGGDSVFELNLLQF